MTLALLPDADRRLLRDATRPPRVGRFNCSYCGARCFGRVCRAHRDLLEVEAELDAPHTTASAPSSDEQKEGN